MIDPVVARKTPFAAAANEPRINRFATGPIPISVGTGAMTELCLAG